MVEKIVTNINKLILSNSEITGITKKQNLLLSDNFYKLTYKEFIEEFSVKYKSFTDTYYYTNGKHAYNKLIVDKSIEALILFYYTKKDKKYYNDLEFYIHKKEEEYPLCIVLGEIALLIAPCTIDY